MTCAAVLVDGPTRIFLSGLRMPPPAESTNELNHTVRPSYLAPCSSMKCGLPCLASLIASSIISFHVLGGVGTRSLRYHSNWVLELIGAA
jgi:hypothetical protein